MMPYQKVLVGLCALLVMGGGCSQAHPAREETAGQSRRSLGTAVPERVRDINPLPNTAMGSGPGSLAVVGDTVFFAANGGEPGSELWKSDGTQAGTVMVKDIVPGRQSSSPAAISPMGGLVYFTTAQGDALWKSDGTEAGTVLVKRVHPRGGYAIRAPQRMVPFQGNIYFKADDGSGKGTELWKSDGTEAGTKMVKDINPGTGNSDPQELVAMEDALYFTAIDAAHGKELWRTDGTEEGTYLVKDIAPGSSHSFVFALVRIGGTLYFSANDGRGMNLWKTDGTEEGTVKVETPAAPYGLNPSYPMALGDVLYFNNSSDGELWRSDGTAAGTYLVKDINPSGQGAPWIILASSNALYFYATDGAHGFELWTSDGTQEGTRMVKDILPGAGSSFSMWVGEPVIPVVMDGVLYFNASDGVHGPELWRSDGTEEGTYLVKDITPGAYGSGVKSLAAVGHVLYFNAGDDTTREELWRSDGTPEGTFLVKDIHPTWSSSPKGFTGVGELVFFLADDGKSGVEVWRTDGTQAGTWRVKDLLPGTTSSNPEWLTSFEGALYFTATDGVDGVQLWKSDGTPEGTTVAWKLAVGDLLPTPEGLTRVGASLFFAASDGVSGLEPWRVAPPPDTTAPLPSEALNSSP